jgi:hypothetical protein
MNDVKQNKTGGGGRLYGRKQLLATYVEPSEANKFRALAKSRRYSIAHFLRLLILHINHQGSQDKKSSLRPYELDKKKTHTFTSHLSEGEAKRLMDEADRHDMKPSPFINMILRGVLTKTVSLSVVEQDEIRSVRASLTKIGTNLNQAVKLLKANPYGENIITAKLIEEIQDILNTEKQILQDLLIQNVNSWANLYGEETR